MKQLYLFIACSFILANAFTQDTTAYFTGFDNASEQDGWEQFRLGGEMSPNYLWKFQNAEAYSDPNCLIHDYPVAAIDTTDDWYVSPAFHFENGGVVDSIWAAYDGWGTPMNADTVALYLLTGNKDPSLASELIFLHLLSDSTYQNDNTWRKISNILIPETQDSAYLAFRYTTENNWLDVRFDDMGLRQFGMADTSDTVIIDGIFEESSESLDFNLYPNPGTDIVTIDIGSDETARIEVTNALGEIIYTNQANRKTTLPRLSSGLYFVTVRVNDTEGTHKLIME